MCMCEGCGAPALLVPCSTLPVPSICCIIKDALTVKAVFGLAFEDFGSCFLRHLRSFVLGERMDIAARSNPSDGSSSIDFDLHDSSSA